MLSQETSLSPRQALQVRRGNPTPKSLAGVLTPNPNPTPLFPLFSMSPRVRVFVHYLSYVLSHHLFNCTVATSRSVPGYKTSNLAAARRRGGRAATASEGRGFAVHPTESGHREQC